MSSGYSGTPLAQKLGIKEGARVAFVAAPDGFDETVAPLPDGVEVIEGDITQPIAMTVRTRLMWLLVNLPTAMLAASVVSALRFSNFLPTKTCSRPYGPSPHGFWLMLHLANASAAK